MFKRVTTAKSQQGFTLLELIVVITVIGVLAALTTPNYQTYNKNVQLERSVREFVSLIQLARSEAIQRNTFVNVETQADEKDNFGEEIWICTAADNGTDCANDDSLIRKMDFSSSHVFIRTSGGAGQADDNISFNQKGQLAEADEILVGFCDDRGDTTRKAMIVSINVTGRPFAETLDITKADHKCDPN